MSILFFRREVRIVLHRVEHEVRIEMPRRAKDKIYVDNPLNRRMGRLGKPCGYVAPRPQGTRRSPRIKRLEEAKEGRNLRRSRRLQGLAP